MIRKLKRLWHNFSIKSMLYSIHKICSYAVFLWSNNDFDGCNLINLIGYKIKRMREYFEWENKHNFGYVGQQKHLKQMKVCEILCKRIYEDFSSDNAHDAFEKRWGKTKINFKPLKGKRASRLKITYEHPTTISEKKQREFEKKLMYKRIEAMEKQETNYLFEILRKHSKSWWS